MNTTTTADDTDIVYPDSDGMPMAENTVQYEWIVTLKGNLDLLFAADPNVFVAGDHLIYPVRGDNTTRQAPDVYVAIGRPKRDRGSYKVWEEGGLFPQVVFEVLSPGNRSGEMLRKRAFYRRFGVEEYYVVDPDDKLIEGWVRDGGRLQEVPETNGFASPRLGIRFVATGDELAVYYPDGRRFLTFVEIGQQAEQARLQAETAQQQAEQARLQAETARQQAETARQQAEQSRHDNDRLRAMLRVAGIDPDQPMPG